MRKPQLPQTPQKTREYAERHAVKHGLALKKLAALQTIPINSPNHPMKRKHQQQLAALQKANPVTHIPQPPPIPGIIQAKVSCCCGATTYTRERKQKTVTLCQSCHYETDTQVKIVAANIVPAYGRRPVTEAAALDLFYRGMDFSVDGKAPYLSIRNMANFAALQIRYGKQLQKVVCITLDLRNKR